MIVPTPEEAPHGGGDIFGIEMCPPTEGRSGGDAGAVDLWFGPGWPEHSVVEAVAGEGGDGGVGPHDVSAAGPDGAAGSVIMTEDPDLVYESEAMDPERLFEAQLQGDRTEVDWPTIDEYVGLFEVDKFIVGAYVDLTFHGSVTIRAREVVIERGATLTIREGDGGLSAPGIEMGDVPQWPDLDGGTLTVEAQRVVVEGNIDVSGLDAIEVPGVTPGGAGGAIRITTTELEWGSGEMRASGGRGDAGLDEHVCP